MAVSSGMIPPFGTNSECPICFKPFDEMPEQTVVALACPKNHLYDLDCLMQWFDQPSVCERKCLICFADADPLLVVRRPALDFLQDACQHNNASVVQEILHKQPELANQAVLDKCTGITTSLFTVAVKSHSRAAALALIDHGLDVNSLVKYDDGEDVYPLHVAAAQGDVAVVAKLLGNGAAVDCLTQSGSARRATLISRCMEDQSCIYATPIGWAVKNGHCAVIKQLLDAGTTVQPFDEDDRKDTLLTLAIGCNQPEVVRFLLLLGELKGPVSFGLDDESYVKYLLFALSYAAISGHVAIVELLVGLCNTETVHSRYFLYPLWYAVGYRQKQTLEAMLRSGFKNQISNYGQSLQEYAVQIGNRDIIKLIDKYDANYCVPLKGKILGTLLWPVFCDPSRAFTRNYGPSPYLEKIVGMLVWLLFGL